MKKISNKLKEGQVLVSDGAWGTFLQKKGLKSGECPELWNVTHRNDVLEIAKSYIDAGADMIETNSFGGSRIKLAQYGLEKRAYELNKAAATISREAAGDDKIVLGSVGPTGKFVMMGDVTEEELYDVFKEQTTALAEGGADAVIIETFYDIAEAEAAVKAAKENTECEVICTFTFEKTADGGFKTMMGVSPADMVTALMQAGVDVLGTNCGNGFEDMKAIVDEIRTVNREIPVLVHANAGMPEIQGDDLYYPETPEKIKGIIPGLLNAGVNIIGGCCGTTPEHVKIIKQIAEK